jgi:hypothetical protein
MAPPKLDIPPELLAEGKRLYEQTKTPLHEIAAMMGISRATLRNRIREWGWTRRQQPSRALDLLHAVRGAAVAVTTNELQGAAAPVTPERRAAIAARIMDVVERQMDAVERVLDTVQPNDQGEGERGTRMLASISQTLRETAALVAPEETTQPNETDDDTPPRDIDAFREELARRIHAFIDARQARQSGAGGGDDGGPGRP